MTVPDELVRLARAGDTAAFEELVRATYADAFALARRLTGDDHDAGDAVQEAYLRAYRSLPRFRGESTFSTWLYRITANCSMRIVERRERRRQVALDTVVPPEREVRLAEQRADHDPEARSLQRSELDRVGLALDRLPPRLRAVVVLRDVYDLPHDAIAAELGISATAAKVRLHRARRQLRDHLDPANAQQRSASEPVPVPDGDDLEAVTRAG